MNRHTLASATRAALLSVAIAVGQVSPAPAECPFESGSTNALGAFNPGADVVVDLAEHEDGILNYTTITIPAGVTVTFTRNARNTPVYMLASGDVTINGTINVSGSGIRGTANSPEGAEPGFSGPGGFDGGAGGKSMLNLDPATRGSRGLGPEGGEESTNASGGSGYLNAQLIPLLGGSGGAGLSGNASLYGLAGGGGGGAILIASSGTVTLNGSIVSDGGAVCPFGCIFGGPGAIRIVAQRLLGTGFTRGGVTRLESCEGNFLGSSQSTSSTFGRPPNPVFVAALPTLRIVSVAQQAIPDPPAGSFLSAPDVVLGPGTASAQVALAATNVPTTPTTRVNVVVIPKYSAPMTIMSTPLNGSFDNSTATATIPLTPGETIVMATVTVDVDITEGEPLVTGGIAGERIAQLKVGATYGGGSSVVYVTESGREIPQPEPGSEAELLLSNR
jgi:hypothetical protein